MKRRLQIERMKEIREVGRIRIGEQVAVMQDGKPKTKNGQPVTRPAGRDTFRFTSSNRVLLNALCAIHGGEVRPWAGHQGQFEYDSKCSQIQCFVAFSDVSQVWEQWSGGGCTHRCDGVECDRVVVVDTGRKDDRNRPIFEVDEFVEPCSCISEDEDVADRDRPCKLTTRVKMILPDTKDIGQWRIETHGVIFGDEAMALVEQLSKFGPVACILSLGWQETKKPGKPTNRFVVPSLTLDPNPQNFAKVLIGATLSSQVARELASGNIQALEAANDAHEEQESHGTHETVASHETQSTGQESSVTQKIAAEQSKTPPKEEVEPTPMPEDWHETREESLEHGKSICKALTITAEQIEAFKEVSKDKNLPWHVVMVKAEAAGHGSYETVMAFAKDMEGEPIQGVLVE